MVKQRLWKVVEPPSLAQASALLEAPGTRGLLRATVDGPAGNTGHRGPLTRRIQVPPSRSPRCARTRTQPRAPGSGTVTPPLFCFFMPAFSKDMVSCPSADRHGGDSESPGGFWAPRGHVSVSLPRPREERSWGCGMETGWMGGHSPLTLTPGTKEGGGGRVRGLCVAGAGPASSGTQRVPPSVSGPSLLILGPELGLAVWIPGLLATLFPQLRRPARPMRSKHSE